MWGNLGPFTLNKKVPEKIIQETFDTKCKFHVKQRTGGKL